jgi:AcrR family transcriptional regulator
MASDKSQGKGGQGKGPASARGSRRAGRPSASEAGDLERDVVAAALQEFRAEGLSGASIERIAKAAHVTRSAIYRRYIDKRGLFETVLQHHSAKLKALGDAIIQASDDPLLRVRNTAEAYCRFMLSPEVVDLQRIMVWRAAAPDAATAPPIPSLSLPPSLSEQLDQVIADAQRAGRLQPGPPGLWRDVLVRLVAEGLRWRALASSTRLSPDEITEDFGRMWPLFVRIAGT